MQLICKMVIGLDRNIPDPIFQRLSKSLRVMKLTAVLLIVFGLHVGATGISQTITFKGKNVPLRQAFITIEKQTGFVLLYNPDKLKTKRITINSSSMPLTDFLKEILKGQGLNYLIKDKTIFIRTSPPSSTVFPSFPAEELEPPVTVKGKVTDEKGEPMEGVYVTVKGTDNTTATDQKGEFSLYGVDENATLAFTSVNTDAREIAINGRTVLTIILHRKISAMTDVVVVGYGTQSRRNVTGSVSKVDMEDTRKLPNTNISQALRGRVAGVQFTDDGRPGQNGAILIRGPRSLSGGNDPLIVLDGIFFNGTIANINPNDIASIEILKDASAAAIYGSRAANGVILITSKRGTTEKPTINVNAFAGLSDWSHKPLLLSPERYIQKTLDARKQNGLSADPANIADYLTTTEAENYKNGITTDPWDAISQQGRIHSYDLSISGNNKMTNYYLSGSYMNQHGIVFNDNRDRLSIRANIENQINKNLSVGIQSTYVRQDISGVQASLSTAYAASPFGNWYYEDGEPTLDYVPEDAWKQNAMRKALLTKNENIFNYLRANFYLKLNIPFIRGLNYRINYSPNYRTENTFNFERQDIHIPNVNNTSASKRYRQQMDWVVENILSYDRKFNEDHSVDVTLLYGSNKFAWNSTIASSVRLSSEMMGWNNLGIGEVMTNESDGEIITGVSSMLRMNYRFKDRYLFTLTARKDGSSVFGADNKFATFPSGAFAWIASEESFLKNNKVIDLLKLRVSYGAVGNQAISPYRSLAMESDNRYVFGDGGISSVGSYAARMANSELKWETTYNTNVAVDFTAFNGRLGGVLEWYRLDTKDLLITRSLPSATGFTSTLTNLGGTRNKGVEVTLNTVNIKTGKWEWSSNLLFSYNKNEIVGLYGMDSDGDGKEDDDLGNRWLIGLPIDIAYDYVFDGIYQVEEDGNRPGDVRLKDLNKDGKIDAANDRTMIGQTGQPKYRWGMTNTFRYGKLSLSVFVNAMQGWIGSVNYFRSALRPQNMFDYHWWTEENRSNTSPSFLYENPYGHNYYYKRDFIRVQDVSLSYDLPASFLSGIGVRDVNIWLSGKNLVTFTKWPGMDPENGNSYDGDKDFPMMRSFTFGLSFKL